MKIIWRLIVPGSFWERTCNALIHTIKLCRMVTFYGLCFSMFLIPWKCYLMSTDLTFIGTVLGVEMVKIIFQHCKPKKASSRDPSEISCHSSIYIKWKNGGTDDFERSRHQHQQPILTYLFEGSLISFFSLMLHHKSPAESSVLQILNFCRESWKYSNAGRIN